MHPLVASSHFRSQCLTLDTQCPPLIFYRNLDVTSGSGIATNCGGRATMRTCRATGLQDQAPRIQEVHNHECAAVSSRPSRSRSALPKSASASRRAGPGLATRPSISRRPGATTPACPTRISSIRRPAGCTSRSTFSRRPSGWQEGDEIITSPLTFVSTNHAILYERLKPVFADVDEYLCLDPDDVERKIGPRTRAVMFVGMGGNTGQYDRIEKLCRQRGLRLILDAAHMAGTRLHDRTPNGDVAVFSFQAVKTLPTADAGMICFADKRLRRTEPQEILDGDQQGHLHAHLGQRRLQVALRRGAGRVQVSRQFDHGGDRPRATALSRPRHAYRRQISDWYDAGFGESNRIGIVRMAPGCESSRHLYQVHLENRDEMMVALNGCGIYPGVHYRDNRDYRMFRQERDTCPNATRMSQRIMSLPLHMRLTRRDVDAVIDRVQAYAH